MTSMMCASHHRARSSVSGGSPVSPVRAGGCPPGPRGCSRIRPLPTSSATAVSSTAPSSAANRISGPKAPSTTRGHPSTTTRPPALIRPLGRDARSPRASRWDPPSRRGAAEQDGHVAGQLPPPEQVIGRRQDRDRVPDRRDAGQQRHARRECLQQVRCRWLDAAPGVPVSRQPSDVRPHHRIDRPRPAELSPRLPAGHRRHRERGPRKFEMYFGSRRIYLISPVTYRMQ